MWSSLWYLAHLAFTKQILNKKLHFCCSDNACLIAYVKQRTSEENSFKSICWTSFKSFRVIITNIHLSTPPGIISENFSHCWQNNITHNHGIHKIQICHAKIIKNRLIFHDYVVCIVAKNFPTGIYTFKVNNIHIRTRYEVCSTLTINTPELVSLLLTLNNFTPCFSVSAVNCEQENAGWVCTLRRAAIQSPAVNGVM